MEKCSISAERSLVSLNIPPTPLGTETDPRGVGGGFSEAGYTS